MTEFEKQIENTALRLGDLPEPTPKNLFDILGVRNKETINSRILAYFLDTNENHGLQSLFFDSLKTIIENKKYANPEFLDIFNGEFKVLTEDTTSFAENETKKRIDVSIIGSDKWGVIIENKLYHNLANPLKAYWEHTQKTCDNNIIGIILTLFNLGLENDKVDIKLKNKKVTYLNITHKEWMDEVQKQLCLGDIENTEGLLYLKEYIKTIQSHYNSKMDETAFNALAQSITKQRKEVQEIQNKISETTKFIDEQIHLVFAKFGYEKDKSWFTKLNTTYPVYFYVPSASEILTKNKLWFTLELRYELNKSIRDTENVNKLHSHFESIVTKHHKVRVGKQSVKSHTHIVIASIENVINEQSDFKSAFIKILEDSYMGENGLVKEIENFLKTLTFLPSN